MSAIYNEIEAYAVSWLRNLEREGHIAQGRVDERSIVELQPDDVRGATQFHAFAGIGVWSHALRLAGWPDDVPIWTGSCPCQPFSNAGRKRGFADERHFWPEWFRLIRECLPPIIVGEQVASADGRAWLDVVFADLEALGYACAASDLCAAGVGAPHIRQRLYFVALAPSARAWGVHLRPRQQGQAVPDARRRSAAGVVEHAAFARRVEGLKNERGCGTGAGPRHDGGGSADAGASGRWLVDAAFVRERAHDGLERAGGKRGGRGASGAGEEGGRLALEPDRHGEDGSGLGDAGFEGSGRHARALPRAEGSGDRERLKSWRLAHEPVVAGPVNGFWADAEWVYCRDNGGCFRPVEPGTFPLATRAPARVGKLRAYGNAIVAPLAATFLQSVIDILVEGETVEEQRFDHSFAECDKCELRRQCESGRTVPGGPMPKRFNGIMLVGEGPGKEEVSRGTPFVGPAGHLLNTLLSTAGIKRDECYVTNATLCLPPPKGADEGKKAFFQRFPNAIYSCLPRLEEEIAAVQPKVIVCFGAPALIAATGTTKPKATQVDNDCADCRNTRKVGPALACAVGECDWHHRFVGVEPDRITEARAALLDVVGPSCPKCGASIKRLKVRQIKCPTCGGKKKKIVMGEEFVAQYRSIGEVAGALFRASSLSARWDQLGVDWVITTYHPSFLLRTMEKRDDNSKEFGGQFAARAVTDHLEKALRLTQRPSNFPRFATVLTDQAGDVVEWLREHGEGLYDVDIETNAKNAWDVSELRCVGLSRYDVAEKLVIDTRKMLDITVHEEGTDEEPLPPRFEIKIVDEALYHVLTTFLTSEDFKKSAQNGPQYDWLVLWRLLGVCTGPIVCDLKHAHHHLYPDEPHDLGFISAEQTEVEWWKPPKEIKGEQKWTDFVELAVYNAKDTATTSAARERMAGSLLEKPEDWVAPTGVRIRRWMGGGLLDHPDYARRRGFDVAVELMPIALEMEYHGVPIDFEAFREVEAELRPKQEAIERKMAEYVRREDFNPRSVPQRTWALYDPNGPCKLTCPKATKTGGMSTDKDVLAKLAHHEFVQFLIEWNDYEADLKFLHGKGLIIREDGRIHPSWNSVGTVSHRWTSSPNFQNLMKAMRRLFRAPPGWKIVGADESQLEMRILAVLAGAADLIKRCIEADEKDKLNPACDPHAYVGANFFGPAYLELVDDRKTPEGKEKLDALRTIVKTVFYALGYGSGAATILEGIYKKGYRGSLPLTIQIVRGAMETIFKLFPELHTYGEEAIRMAEREGEVRSRLLGRCRPFPMGKVESTIARNYPIQATAADLVDLRFIEYRRRLRDVSPRSYPILQVHDAIYTLAPEEDAEKVAKVKEEALSCELTLVPGAPSMPFIASAKIGDTLAEVS